MRFSYDSNRPIGTLIFLAFTICLTSTPAMAMIDIVWDSAVPSSNQTIDGTEILVDGSVIGQTTAETYAIDNGAWAPGDYSINVRHTGTVDGNPAVSGLSNTLTYTVADSGAPGVAPMIRFRNLDGVS